MKFLLCLAAVAVAAATEQKIPGDYSVFLKRGATINSISRLLGNSRIVYQAMSGPMQYLHLSHVRPQIAASLADSPLVEVIEQSVIVVLDDPVDAQMGVADITNFANQPPSDPPSCTSHGVQGNAWNWHLIRTSHRNLPDYYHKAHMFVERGGGADVYVLATGVDITHKEFGDRASHSFVASGLGGAHDDIHGHGTHCAGIVAGTLLGIAKDAHILNVKVVGDNGVGSSAGIVEGIVHSHNRAISMTDRRSIVSISLGIRLESQIQRVAITRAINDQVFFIVSAGNSNADTGDHTWPAAFPDTIAVGATEKNNDIFASFSNHGTLMDIAAPGVNIWSAGAKHSTRCSAITAGACIVTMTGTSRSCPLVAGIAAQIIAAKSAVNFMSFSQADLKSELTSTSTPDVISELRGSGTPNRLSYRHDC